MKKLTFAILPLILLLTVSCRDKLEPEVDDFVEYGWVLYENRQFDEAFAEFQSGLVMDSVYQDGWNGLGWIYIEYNDPDSARLMFDEGLFYSNNDSSQVRFEILAGLSFTLHALEEYDLALVNSMELYDFNPLFEFSHNFRINFHDIRVLRAACHFSVGAFDSSLAWLRLEDPAFSADPSTLEGQAQIAVKIEELQNF